MAIPVKIQERLKKGLTKYQRIINGIKDSAANEADTSTVVNRMLEDIFGYDLFDITAEYRIRGQYADYAIRDKKKPRLIIEVKSIGSSLNDNHLYQATSYAANHGIEWVILTNANEWRVYHLTFGKGIEKELLFAVDMLDKTVKPAKKIELLYYLTKESFFKDEIKKYLERQLALSSKNIVRVLLSDPVIAKIRRELTAQTGHRITADDLTMHLTTKIMKSTIC